MESGKSSLNLQVSEDSYSTAVRGMLLTVLLTAQLMEVDHVAGNYGHPLL